MLFGCVDLLILGADSNNDGMINTVLRNHIFSGGVIVVTWKNVKLGAGVKIEKGDAPENENVKEEVKIIREELIRELSTVS